MNKQIKEFQMEVPQSFRDLVKEETLKKIQKIEQQMNLASKYDKTETLLQLEKELNRLWNEYDEN